MGVGPEGDLAVIVGDFDADSEIANIDPREDADLYGDIFTAGHIMTQRSLPRDANCDNFHLAIAESLHLAAERVGRCGGT